MSELPKPTLDQAINDLRDRDTFKVLLNALYNEREALFSDLEVALDEKQVVKIAGRIAQADKTLYLLTQSNDPRPAGCNGWITIKPPRILKRWLAKYKV